MVGAGGALREMVPLKCSAVEAMEQVQGFILPEIRRLSLRMDIDEAPDPTDWFWQFVHPRIATLARKRFDGGFFGDAVETSYKEVNEVMKRIVKDATGKELDGAGLMTTALSASNPIVVRMLSSRRATGANNRAICRFSRGL